MARYSIEIVEEVTSTQDLARERAEQDRPAVVIAHRQTGGRGRGGAVWESAPRSVAVSVAAFLSWRQDRLSLIPLVAAVAARRATDGAVTLKWPNDVMVGEAKVGGILVEVPDGPVVVGLGLNLFWAEPMGGAGGLQLTDPGPEEGPRVAIRFADELLALMGAGPDRWPRREYEEACATLGREVAWEPVGRGQAVGIGPDGALEVVTSDGSRVSLTAGRIRHLRAL